MVVERMDRLLVDTNIFGIAVDKQDSRRASVWKTLSKVAFGERELFVASIVIEEIKKNPHKITMKKELELVENLVSKTFGFTLEAKQLAGVLEEKAGLGVVDAQIVAVAIVNDLVFWSGDRRILRAKTLEDINNLLSRENLHYSFRFKKE